MKFLSFWLILISLNCYSQKDTVFGKMALFVNSDTTLSIVFKGDEKQWFTNGPLLVESDGWALNGKFYYRQYYTEAFVVPERLIGYFRPLSKKRKYRKYHQWSTLIYHYPIISLDSCFIQPYLKNHLR